MHNGKHIEVGNKPKKIEEVVADTVVVSRDAVDVPKKVETLEELDVAILSNSDVDEVVIEEETIVLVDEKKVKIRMKKDHKCNIGGQLYNLKEDKTYSVPPNVRRILEKSPLDLLKPL